MSVWESDFAKNPDWAQMNRNTLNAGLALIFVWAVTLAAVVGFVQW